MANEFSSGFSSGFDVNPANFGTFWELLSQVQSTIAGFAFAPVNIRKLPVKQELDPATQIIVCPGKDEEYKRLAFGGYYTVTYFINVVILGPNNAQELTNLSQWLYWRQQIQDAISNMVVGKRLKQKVTYDPPIAREQIAESYDYVSLSAAFTIWTP